MYVAMYVRMEVSVFHLIRRFRIIATRRGVSKKKKEKRFKCSLILFLFWLLVQNIYVSMHGMYADCSKNT